MSKIVNLRQIRKDKARSEKRALGDANAAKHGVSKVQKLAARQTKDKADRHLDGHKTET
ncbi:DUF4169 family protein [Sagittula sp. SSi028]|uniref:DUF4169 family protein n=1 Tax=Sagittula sp. SSi028 TaxID=3400636 RepID=UPI003AF692B4